MTSQRAHQLAHCTLYCWFAHVQLPNDLNKLTYNKLTYKSSVTKAQFEKILEESSWRKLLKKVLRSYLAHSSPLLFSGSTGSKQLSAASGGSGSDHEPSLPSIALCNMYKDTVLSYTKAVCISHERYAACRMLQCKVFTTPVCVSR